MKLRDVDNIYGIAKEFRLRKQQRFGVIGNIERGGVTIAKLELDEILLKDRQLLQVLLVVLNGRIDMLQAKLMLHGVEEGFS